MKSLGEEVFINITEQEFALLAGVKHWYFSDPSAERYYEQKQIRLNVDMPQSVEHFESVDTWIDNEFGRTQDDRRWRYLFYPRVRAAAGSNNAQFRALFPGDQVFLNGKFGSEQKSYCTQLQIGRWHSFQDFQSGGSHISPDNANSELSEVEDAWLWRLIELPSSRVYSYSDLPHSPQMAVGKDLRQFVSRSKWVTTAGLIQCLEKIHDCWSEPSVRLSYETDLLSFARTIPSDVITPENDLSVLFELELIASYCSAVSKYDLVGSGFYGNLWIDVVSVDPFAIRASEQCQPMRVLQELLNLSHGRTAPIVVNEFGCVSDGNHRMAAISIWNLLHACAGIKWSMSSDAFQKQAESHYKNHLTDTTQAGLIDSLRCLQTLLSGPETTSIIRNLRGIIESRDITSVPAVLAMEYCSFAAFGRLFEQSQRMSRFPPSAYELLLRDPASIFESRACFHFADRVPLPWFSLVSDPKLS